MKYLEHEKACVQVWQEYHAALHAMQSGVRAECESDWPNAAACPKHLRVGVNACMVQQAALAHLLIEKGVINDFEYASACKFYMDEEVLKYRTRIAERLGVAVERIQLV